MLQADYEKVLAARSRVMNKLAALNSHRRWRYATPRGTLAAGQNVRFGRELARLVAEYRADGECTSDLEDIVALINEAPNGYIDRRGIIVDLDLEDSVWRCDSCGQLIVEDIDSGHMDEHSNRVCDDCVYHGDYVWSECGGYYISGDSSRCPVFNSVASAEHDSPDDWCTRRYGGNALYGFDHANYAYAFFAYEEDYCDWCNEDEDEDEDEDDTCLPDYHDSPFRTSSYFNEVNEGAKRPALGVEVEVYTGVTRSDALSDIRNHPHPWVNGLVLERDGSLHDGESFEVVTRPFGVEEWKTFSPMLCEALQRAGCVGYNTPGSTRYGIHVNLHRRWLSPLAEFRMMMFLCAEQNRSFVQAIAQRDTIYHPEINIGQLASRDQSVYTMGGLPYIDPIYTGGDRKRKIHGRGKYVPLSLKRDIAEFRLFQSTLNVKSFVKNLEFVWALYAWTKPESTTGRSWDHVDFCKWLNTPANRKQYPMLVEYLSKKHFTLKGGGAVASTWGHLMFKPADDLFIEPRAA